MEELLLVKAKVDLKLAEKTAENTSEGALSYAYAYTTGMLEMLAANLLHFIRVELGEEAYEEKLKEYNLNGEK